MFTPYKDMNDAIENPCVYVSEDGEHFDPLDGANPLDEIFLPKSKSIILILNWFSILT